MTTPLSRALAVTTGIALIALPLIGLALKLVSFGWMMLVLLFVSPLFAAGYILQIVIASTGYLSSNAVLVTGASARRALVAAWVTSISFVLVCLFFVDGGDADWGSSFMYLFGLQSNDAVAGISTFFSIVFTALWVSSWIWLLVEWIRALVARRRARAAVAA